MRRCPICESSDVHEFWTIESIPVHCNLLCGLRSEAQSETRGNMRLVFCTDCTYIWNAAFLPALMQYSPRYTNALECSPRFRQYINELASDIVSRHQLSRKLVLEIGCGDGAFLRLLCNLAQSAGVGFDPSYRKPDGSGSHAEGVTFVADFFGEEAAVRADFVCCRQTLEHIANPRGFLSLIRGKLAETEDASVFFEVPNGAVIFRDLSIFDLIYEHCSYFTVQSLAWLFSRCGFRQTLATATFGRQYLCVEGTRDADGFATATPASEIRLQDIRSFGRRFHNKVQEWRSILRCHRAAGERVVVWGAGSKAVSFLNLCGEGSGIEYVVDINPGKQGMYVAGTGQEIVAPEFLRSYRPDIIIVMNRLYTAEIGARVEQLGLRVSWDRLDGSALLQGGVS